jgi:hypothetical protein
MENQASVQPAKAQAVKNEVETSLKKTSSMPLIKDLFSQSWEAFVKSILNLFLISIISLVVSLLVLLVAGLGIGALVFASGLIDSVSGFNFEAFSSVQPIWWLLGGIWLVLLVLASIIIQLTVKVASILVVVKYQEQPSLGKTIKASFGLILPLFLTNFLVSLLTFGGFFVLVLPAILLGFLFMFQSFEVVLAGKKYLKAVKASLQITSQHFGEILVRILVYLIAYFLIILFIPGLISKINPEAGVAFQFLTVIINFLLGFFGLAYSVSLYKQAKEITDFERKVSFGWVWLVSILGWLIFGLLIFFGVRVWQSGVFQKSFQESLLKPAREEKILDFNGLESTLAPVIPPPAAATCLPYKIREGEFASDKCYSQADYDDLIYYLQRHDAAVFSYDTAVSSMEITCSGSDFFKDDCEQDKAKKEAAEADIGSYRQTINGIITRGK